MIHSKPNEYYRGLFKTHRRLHSEITRLLDTFGFFQNRVEEIDALNYGEQGRIANFLLSCETVSDEWLDCKGKVFYMIATYMTYNKNMRMWSMVKSQRQSHPLSGGENCY